ncbi:MAG TPA: hypothetical protein VEU98_03785 [Candidatus Eremiobacteraceae bacterium]|nr:hypothetical protein [Candidatus Eremiobacteraceae bacterium]
MTRSEVSAEVGINFVGDPIIFEKEGEKHSGEPKCPTIGSPRCVYGGTRKRKIYDVSSGITDIGDKGEKNHREEIGEMKSRTEMRPGNSEPDGAHGEEDKIVQKAPRFPVACGRSEKVAERRLWRNRKSWRGHGDTSAMQWKE